LCGIIQGGISRHKRRQSTGIIDEVLRANETYAEDFTQGKLPVQPAKKLVVVASTDARLALSQILCMGDIHTIRNAGGIMTEVALRSFIISHYPRGAR